MHVALPKSRGDKLPPSEQRIGFLAANRDASLGYVGGYLITTARGRPLEFHYTSPVNPSPTHRILYGTELEPYIFGELIGPNLLRQSTLEVAFMLTDQPHILGQRKTSSCPIIVVAPVTTSDGAAGDTTPSLRGHSEFPEDVAALTRWLQEANPGLSLADPFARVWEALREVLKPTPKNQAA
jgi:hypothetical protein